MLKLKKFLPLLLILIFLSIGVVNGILYDGVELVASGNNASVYFDKPLEVDEVNISTDEIKLWNISGSNTNFYFNKYLLSTNASYKDDYFIIDKSSLEVYLEAEDNANDTMGNLYPTVENGLGYTDSNKFFGKAFDFNGGDLISLHANYVFNNKSSVSVWFKTDGQATTKAILGNYGNSYNQWFRISANGNLDVESDTNNDKCISSETDANDGNWHHAVFVFDNYNCKFYLDGEELSLVDSGLHNNLTVDTIGTINGNSNFSGLMDEIRFYKDTLSQDEINKLYHIPPYMTRFEWDEAGRTIRSSRFITYFSWYDKFENKYVTDCKFGDYNLIDNQLRIFTTYLDEGDYTWYLNCSDTKYSGFYDFTVDYEGNTNNKYYFTSPVLDAAQATKIIIYSAFGLIAVSVIVLAGFILVNIMKNGGDYNTLLVALLTMIGIAIVVFIGYIVVQHVYKVVIS